MRTGARVTHGARGRLALVSLGIVFMLGGWGFGWVLVRALTPVRPSDPMLRVLLILLLFWGIGAYGAFLFVRGLRGWSRFNALDRASPPFERAFRELGVVVWMGFGVVAWTASGGRAPMHLVPWVFWSLLVAMVGLPLWVVVHEIGHLVPGLLQGRTPMELHLWPVRIERSPSGAVRVRAAWRAGQGVAGQVLWEPLGPLRSPAADRMMILGGPLANALAAVVLVLAAGAVGPDRGTGLPAFLLAGALGNAVLAVVNLLPLGQTTGVPLDGARVLRTFGRGYRATQRRERLLALSLRARPRDWDVNSAELLSVETDRDEDRAWFLLLAASVALDRGDRTEAERALALRTSVPKAPLLVARELSLQTVLVRALLGGDALGARAELAASPQLPMMEDGYADLALAAVLLVEGVPGDAARALARWKERADAQRSWVAGNQWALERLERALPPA